MGEGVLNIPIYACITPHIASDHTHTLINSSCSIVDQQREAITSPTCYKSMFSNVKIHGQIFGANTRNISSLNIEDD